jgi:hypothetical protein
LTETFVKYLREDTLGIGDDGREEAGLRKNGEIDGKVADAGSNAGSSLNDNVSTRVGEVHVQIHDRHDGMALICYYALWDNIHK